MPRPTKTSVLPTKPCHRGCVFQVRSIPAKKYPISKLVELGRLSEELGYRCLWYTDLRFATECFIGLAAIGISWAAVPAARGLAPWLPALATRAPFWFSIVLCLFGSCFLGLVARRTPGLYGLHRPAGRDAWWMLGPALLGALAGGVWLPALELPRGPLGAGWLAWLAFPLLPLGAEILFRGLVQGSLGWVLRMQRVGGPWLLTWPTLLSAAFYAPWGIVLASISVLESPAAAGAWHAPVWGGLVFGAAAGVARERSESLLLPILLHGICLTAVLLVRAIGA